MEVLWVRVVFLTVLKMSLSAKELSIIEVCLIAYLRMGYQIIHLLRQELHSSKTTSSFKGINQRRFLIIFSTLTLTRTTTTSTITNKRRSN